MMRLPDWEARLAALVVTARDRPHAWGSWDCGHLAAAAVLAVTGEDLGAEWRGRYRTKAGAARAMRRNGCAGVPDVLTRALGIAVGPLLAGRGDLVCNAEGAAGVVLGERALTVTEGAGADWIERRDWTQAWMVGADG